MSGPPSENRSPRDSVFRRARELAEEVRATAERVHREALEARRLIEIALQQSERGRNLSRSGHQGVESVKASIKWSVDAAHRAERRLAGKGED